SFISITLQPPLYTLFPYTTLFRSLEDALLRASPAVPADKLQNGSDERYRIPKDKYDLVLSAIKRSEQFCSAIFDKDGILVIAERSEEHTSEPSHVSISYAVFCLKK